MADSGRTIGKYLTFFNIFYTISVNCQMENTESTEELYKHARNQHVLLDRRLKMLMKKSYLTSQEELEMKVLKKKKLYYKDIMDKTGHSLQREEKD